MNKLKEIHYKTKLLSHSLNQLTAHLEVFDHQLDVMQANGEAPECIKEIEYCVQRIEDFLEDMLLQYRDGRFVPIHNTAMIRVHYGDNDDGCIHMPHITPITNH